MLSHTVVDIHGDDRLEGVTIAKVDENRRPIDETRQFIKCDTLLLSCGLIPENELTKDAGISLDRVTNGAYVDGGRETDIPGVFACGNVLHVHDLVDYVSEEAGIAGKAAVKFIRGEAQKSVRVNVSTDGQVRYTVPQRLTELVPTRLYFRVADVYRDKKLQVVIGENIVYEKKKQKLAPGEMETVEISAEMISQAAEAGVGIRLQLV
jgi:hypothetical protein